MSAELVFDALASNPRRKILAYLGASSLTAGEIAERFAMSKPALSKHLAILQAAGLVTSEKRGQYVHYQLASDNLVATLHTWLASVCPVGGPLVRAGAQLRSRDVAEPLAQSCSTGVDGKQDASHDQ